MSRLSTGLAAATALAGLTVVTATPALAAGDQPPPKKAAVVSPTISTLSFIDTVLLPLGCSTGVGAISSGAASVPGASDAVGSTFAQVTDACAQGSVQVGMVLDQAAGSVGPLAAINSVVNPGIDATATGLTMISTNYGPALAPFGPTVAATAADVLFFKGS